MACANSVTQPARGRASTRPLDNPQQSTAPKLPGRTGTHGRGKGRALEAPGAASASSSKSSAPQPPNIVWDETHIQELVSWLITCPADRHILYHDHNQTGSTPPFPPSEWPSGKQKKDVHAAIAKHIFEGKDHEYTNNPDRYVTSVSNQLTACIYTVHFSLHIPVTVSLFNIA